MDFLKLVQSLDDLLYETMSWLIFYPVTLWRVLVRPMRMMGYADSELSDAESKQYIDTLSPPLFLLLTLILIHAVEIAVVGQSELVGSKQGLNTFIDDDTNLIILRAVTFSLFPLVMASRLVRKQGIGLDRNTLRPPFYSQCYATAVFALAISSGEILIRLAQPWTVEAGAVLSLAALGWFGTLQVVWFARHLKISLWRGFLNASFGMVESLAGTAGLGLLFA